MSERMTTSPDHASTGELIARLSEQTSTLIRDEMRLAQAEMSQKAKTAGTGLGMFGASGLLALLGLGAGVATAIIALALVLPTWAAALIVTVTLLAVAGIVALMGKKKVQQAKPTPERTIANVKEDVATVKENASR
ncbi:MAG: phage holin family protein [Ornithinimicrobium sp.]